MTFFTVTTLLQAQTPVPTLFDTVAQMTRTSATGVAIVTLFVVMWIALIVTRRILLRIVHRVTERTESTWDDTIREERVFHRVAHVAPALAMYYGILLVPDLLTEVVELIQHVALAFMVLMFVSAAHAFLTAVNRIYVAEYEHAASRPIKGYLQIVAIFLWIAGGIVALSIFMQRDPIYFLSGLGALAAVLMLVFRTTILSFVASIQIASNDMVRVGDWIEMPQYGADGDVVDIALHTVKVQNWDKTITTVPTHALVESSFKNWRGMSESGGRRIKRSVMIDMNSVRFLEPDEIQRLARNELLDDYLEAKRLELEEYQGLRPNRPEGIEPTPRRLTNVGTFRYYLLAYLRNHPGIHKDMTLLVRQLAPGPEGLPIEMYCFTSDTAWASYEDLQADVIDHLIAIAPDFGLRVFQNPAGSDFAAAVTRSGEE